MSTSRTPAPLIDLADAAAYLGVAKCTVRRYVAEGKLKGRRLGPRVLRFELADLEAMLQPVGGAI